METSKPGLTGMIQSLDAVLAQRKQADPASSYTAKLFSKGLPKILAKVVEESCETVEAAYEEGSDHLVAETADLWFHTLVLLHHKGRSGADVLAELSRRFGTSGIEEKNSRSKESQ
jgi:phosphoribosyl-ATP pyrophosphohydrolase